MGYITNLLLFSPNEIIRSLVFKRYNCKFAPQFNSKKMNAIVEIAGQQFKVEKGQEIYVHRLKGKEGDKVEFDNVLLKEDNGKVTVGPLLKIYRSC